MKTKQEEVYLCYSAKNKPTFAHLSGKSGIYFLYRDEELVYIGFSKYDLYKTMSRHFQKWDGKKGFGYGQYRVQFPQTDRYKYSVILCSPLLAKKRERELIQSLKPPYNIKENISLNLYVGRAKVGVGRTKTEIEDDRDFKEWFFGGKVPSGKKWLKFLNEPK
jgi:hypothetical protein